MLIGAAGPPARQGEGVQTTKGECGQRQPTLGSHSPWVGSEGVRVSTRSGVRGGGLLPLPGPLAWSVQPGAARDGQRGHSRDQELTAPTRPDTYMGWFGVGGAAGAVALNQRQGDISREKSESQKTGHKGSEIKIRETHGNREQERNRERPRGRGRDPNKPGGRHMDMGTGKIRMSEGKERQ